MDALPEHMYESDDGAVRSENQDENDEPLEEDDDCLIQMMTSTETAIDEDVPTTKDGLKDNQTLGVSSSPTAPGIGPQSTHFYCCIRIRYSR